MPTEIATNNMQRALADAIVQCASLDEIRILLACGAKINDPVTQGNTIGMIVMRVFDYLSSLCSFCCKRTSGIALCSLAKEHSGNSAFTDSWGRH